MHTSTGVVLISIKSLHVQADIYWPPGVESRVAPLLVFIYGGAFRSGARVFPPPHDLTYRNVGAFFAKQG